MPIFNFFKKKPDPIKEGMRDNPHLNLRHGFASDNVSRLLQGWETSNYSIDHYLKTELRPLRARSREMVRSNPYGKKFISTMKSNVVGPQGVVVHAQSTLYDRPDMAANDALEKAFLRWGDDPRHCDYHGRQSWTDIQNMAITCAAQDGEFLIRIHRNAGPYGLQLEVIDPELLDTELSKDLGKKGEIRLGLEYDRSGRVKKYHFKRKKPGVHGTYDEYERYSVDEKHIIHGFIPEFPDQSRGIPWLHASLERSKHLDKYTEAAIVKARSTASTMAFIKSQPGDGYEGEETWGDHTIDQYEPGTIKDIGDREIVNVDSSYPHQMYSSFVKAQLQSIASGLGISYASLSADLEGVNYSSIRAGVLEDREIFKGIQNWLIRCLIRPIWEEWITLAYMNGALKVGRTALKRPVDEYFPAHFQARRWSWVDPQKDGYANEMALRMRLKSRSQIIREMGDDPEAVFNQCKADDEMLKRLGLEPVEQTEAAAPAAGGSNEGDE